MSIDLDIRVYPATAGFSAIETFSSLAEAVSSWSQVDGKWSSLKFGTDSPHETASRATGPLSTDEIIHLSSQRDLGQDCRIHSSIPIQCWRYDGTNATLGQALLDIDCWGPDSQRLIDGDLTIEGNASISVHPANPYWIVLDEGSAEGGKEYNERVAENLDALGELLIGIARVSRPRSMKLFADEGWMLPHNSHCTYFNEADAVVADLHLIGRVWEQGLPAYGGMPPLRDYDAIRHEFTLSSLRPAEQRRDLWEEFSRRLPLLQHVTPRMVESALEVTAIDVHRLNGGFFVFDYPYFLNSFVAPFYLDVLDMVLPGQKPQAGPDSAKPGNFT